MNIPTPIIHGCPAPGLEVVIRFDEGKGYLPIIRNRQTMHEYGRGRHCPTIEAAARLASDSLEATA